MLPFIENKGDCTGCTACLSACPIHCISMECDKEGFLYPVSSDSCIHCGLCERICPIKNPDNMHNSFQQRAFAGISKNNKIWHDSASGGAFSEICRAWGNDETVYCGAAWEDLSVRHKCIEGYENIGILRKSKYVASNVEGVFPEIKCELDKGKFVVFSGTPCQVAGLKKYLKKNYEKLLLIDLICHGVGSPLVFEECMKQLGNQFHGKVISYSFRSKRRLYEMDHIQKINVNEDNIYVMNDQYIQLFLSQNCLRPCCGQNCRFRNLNRQGDITIADFKGLTKVFPDMVGEKYNYSTIVFNSHKGYEMLSKLSKTMNLRECSMDEIKKHNPLIYRQTSFSKNRDTFFSDFTKSPSEAIQKWTKPAEYAKLGWKRRLFGLLPVALRRMILAVIDYLTCRGGVIDRESIYSSCSYSSARIIK